MNTIEIKISKYETVKHNIEVTDSGNFFCRVANMDSGYKQGYWYFGQYQDARRGFINTIFIEHSHSSEIKSKLICRHSTEKSHNISNFLELKCKKIDDLQIISKDFFMSEFEKAKELL